MPSIKEWMDSLPASMKARGIIVFRGRIYHVQVLTSLLILDAISWATALEAHYREQADAVMESFGDSSAAQALRDQADDFARFLTTHRNAPMPIDARVAACPWQVDKYTLHSYVERLLEMSVESDGPWQFVFRVDTPTPTICALPNLRSVIKHTGPDVLGARVSAEELEDIIGRVLHLQAA